MERVARPIVPKGHPRIAQRFNVGIVVASMIPAPKGRLRFYLSGVDINLSRPVGTNHF